ncbi:MAG TPA: hypothetical protein VFQ35_12160 [Polyangiaceae bacterium]|nr:hypothetical protein [Polyangiaceae bacterium]
MLLLAVVSSVLALECSTIVGNELDDVRCTADNAVGPPACESGWFCGYGRCRVCAATEACGDDLDNDCNGRRDDGCAGAGGLGSGGADGGSGGTGLASGGGGASANSGSGGGSTSAGTGGRAAQ